MKNIIFDLGNVLILFDPSGYVNKSVSPEKFLDVVSKVMSGKNWIWELLVMRMPKKYLKKKTEGL